jgi:sugar (pentulose or hexulose) kinase
LLGGASGAVAGLVAVTPAAGTSGVLGAIALGVVASLVCYAFVGSLKHRLQLDDSLDVFGIHGLGGIVGSIGTGHQTMSHHELMTRGHRGIQQVLDLPAPIIVAIQGWAIGGSFQRALLCDIRIAAEGARFMLPEVTHGVIPDTGGVVFVPALSGLFAPHWRADATGLVRGLTQHSSRAHLCRALLQGIACSNCDILAACAADSGLALALLKVDGGVARMSMAGL